MSMGRYDNLEWAELQSLADSYLAEAEQRVRAQAAATVEWVETTEPPDDRDALLVRAQQVIADLRAYEPGSHPHAAAGSPTGGQFVATNTDKPQGQKQKRKPRPAQHPHAPVAKAHDDGTLAYDPAHGTGPGYGTREGDPRVRRLQAALIRLGVTSGDGGKLKLDGKLGPRTTAAVRKAQQRLGLDPDGKVTPALLEKLADAKTLPRPHRHTARRSLDPGDEFADPGLQPDGVPRYPVDSYVHLRASWEAIAEPGNAARYTTDQLVHVKTRIAAAAVRLGVPIDR